MIVRLALVAAAVAALVVAASRSHPQAPDATDLALPMLLAVAVGLLCGLLVLVVSELWVRWSASRRALSSYVASRTVRRRREGTLVILPVTAALTVAVFTVGVSLAASTWRASAAATEVGAPLSFSTNLSLSRAVGLTQRARPRRPLADGRRGQHPQRRRGLGRADAPRRRRHHAAGSGRHLALAVDAGRCRPHRSRTCSGPQRPSVILTGSQVTVAVDNQVRGDFRQLGLSLDDPRRRGRRARDRRRPLPPGHVHRDRAAARLPAGLPAPDDQLRRPVGAGGGDARHRDHRVVHRRRPTGAGRPRRALAGGALPGRHAARGPRAAEARRTGTSRCRSTRARSSSYAGISPTDVPAVVPVLWGRTADPVDPAADRLVGAVHGPLGRHRRVGPLPRAVGHADRLHDVRPQHQPGQQHQRGVRLGPGRHAAVGARPAGGPRAGAAPRPRRPPVPCSTRTRSPSPCGSTSWSRCW